MWLLSVLPLGLLRRFGSLAGWIAAALNGQAAAVTTRNLELCYPDLTSKERKRLARSSLGHTANLLLEAGIVWRWSADRCRALVQDPQALETLRSTLAKPEGTLLLVPHLGNWEFFSPWMSQLNLVALYDPPNIAALDGPIRRVRERAGIRMLPADGSGVREVYRVLGDGGFVVVLPDQLPGRQRGGVYAPFFAQPALTMTLIQRLVKRTRPNVLMATALRVPGGFDVHLRQLDTEQLADAESSAAVMNQAIEDLVALDPAQYQWEYKRFRRQPKGSPDVYKAI